WKAEPTREGGGAGVADRDRYAGLHGGRPGRNWREVERRTLEPQGDGDGVHVGLGSAGLPGDAGASGDESAALEPVSGEGGDSARGVHGTAAAGRPGGGGASGGLGRGAGGQGEPGSGDGVGGGDALGGAGGAVGGAARGVEFPHQPAASGRSGDPGGEVAPLRVRPAPEVISPPLSRLPALLHGGVAAERWSRAVERWSRAVERWSRA